MLWLCGMCYNHSAFKVLQSEFSELSLTPLLLQLAGRGLIKGRDHLMWVLLQFISGSIQKNALADFLPVMKLFDLLYPEKEV